MSFARQELLSVVERSPELVAAHDRTGWLGLFTEDAVVEDPVGVAPAAKSDGGLERFWDTFIAPHDIRFEILGDHFLGNDVFRDAIIHTRVRDGVEVRVEAYLLYQLVERDGTLRVRRMAAHWKLGRMTATAMGMGPRAWMAMTGLFRRMTRTMGAKWVAVYLASIGRGIGPRGTWSAKELGRIIEVRDVPALQQLFLPGAQIELGEQIIEADGLLEALSASNLIIDAPVAAGWTTSFRFQLDGATPREGLCLLEFDPRDQRIARARFFPP